MPETLGKTENLEKSIWYIDGAMTTTKNTIDRFNLYQNGDRGCRWNPNIGEWELYKMDSDDNSIQDLWDVVRTREEAETWVRDA